MESECLSLITKLCQLSPLKIFSYCFSDMYFNILSPAINYLKQPYTAEVFIQIFCMHFLFYMCLFECFPCFACACFMFCPTHCMLLYLLTIQIYDGEIKLGFSLCNFLHYSINSSLIHLILLALFPHIILSCPV